MSDATDGRRLYQPYAMMLTIYLILLAAAFIFDKPSNIAEGLIRIVTSRSMLITDYAQVGGLGAMLVNSVLVGIFSIGMLILSGVKPGGAIIMGLWLNNGFAFFGKNLFNMCPLTLGVFLYAKVKKEPFKNFSLVSLLSATLSPVVSAISLMNVFNPIVDLIIGILAGVAAGFIFPIISSYVVRVHAGYDLYNVGFAGGLISTFLLSVLKSIGIEFPSAMEWSSGNNLKMACLLYIIGSVLLAFGIFSPQKADTLSNLKKIMGQSGRLVTDFYLLYKESVYVNMGILCVFATTTSLALGLELNGPVTGGILTIIGFGGFGKHLRNITPILIGSVLSTYVNTLDPRAPYNSLAILFSTGLAPIAGQFGWVWGIIAGFLHVNISLHIGYLNNGLNLYNNGFAAGFVALFLVPLILNIRKGQAND